MVLTADSSGGVRARSSTRRKADLRSRARESAERDRLAAIVRHFKTLTAALLVGVLVRLAIAAVLYALGVRIERSAPLVWNFAFGLLPAMIGGASTIPLCRTVSTKVGLLWCGLVMFSGLILPWLIRLR